MAQGDAWRGEPLPRGRHKLSSEEVRQSQRERLLRAMIEVVGEKGFAATTVTDVVGAARASRNAFYDHFADKEDCFIVACDESAEELLAQLVAFDAEERWVDALRRGMGLYLRWWAQRPRWARAYFVALPTAGERALEQRERVYRGFEAMFRGLAQRARDEQPELPPLLPLVPQLLVSSITELVGSEVRAGRTEELEQLEPELMRVTVKLLADEATSAALDI
jgi:AcrR family transcriptional regulator